MTRPSLEVKNRNFLFQATHFSEMKCLEDPNKQKAVEAELHRLLDTVLLMFSRSIMTRDIGDSASIVTYMIEFIKQTPGSKELVKNTLIKNTEIFLTSGWFYFMVTSVDTERVVNSLFEMMDRLENDPTEPTEETETHETHDEENNVHSEDNDSKESPENEEPVATEGEDNVNEECNTDDHIQQQVRELSCRNN